MMLFQTGDYNDNFLPLCRGEVLRTNMSRLSEKTTVILKMFFKQRLNALVIYSTVQQQLLDNHLEVNETEMLGVSYFPGHSCKQFSEHKFQVTQKDYKL